MIHGVGSPFGRADWTAWGVLGAPRLHCTIATGEVISKEAAGEYALSEFGPQWQPLIREALCYWREEPEHCLSVPIRQRTRMTAEFVSSVVEHGERLLR